jgi:hypothetical protein
VSISHFLFWICTLRVLTLFEVAFSTLNDGI